MRHLLVIAALAAACNSADQTPDRSACGGECPAGQSCGADDVCHPNPPDTMLVSTPPALGNQTTVSFTFDATLAGATFACRVDDRAPEPCTSPYAVSVDEGVHFFEVVASVNGLPDQTAARHEWRVDLTPPDTTIGGPRITNQATVQIGITALEENSRLDCSFDGGIQWAPCPSGGLFGPNQEGTYTVTARGVDQAGNPDLSPAEWTWRVDLTPPTARIDGAPNALTNSRNAAFAFSSNEPEGATFFCQLDDGAEEPCASGKSYSTLAVTQHTFRVRTVDAATNPSPVVSHTWTIDTSSPDTVVDAQPAALTRLVSTRFDFHATVANATFRCKLDAQAEVDCTSPRTFDVGEGAHAFVMTARSAAGVPDVDPARVTWTVDLTPPSAIDIDSPNTASVASNDLTPTLSGDTDPDTDVLVFRSATCLGTSASGRSNGAGRWSITVPAGLAAAANTTTTYTAQASDAAGNPRCSAAFTYRTDTADPAIARTTPDLSVPYRLLPRPTFGGTAEANAKVRVFRGTQCTGPATAQVTASGGNWSVTLDAATEAPDNASTTYSAQAVDASGNDACTADFVYVTDNAAPSLSRTSPDLAVTYQLRRPTFGGTTEVGARVRIFRGVDCAGPVTADVIAPAGGNWSVTIGAATEAILTGDTAYSAQARDAAGNPTCINFVYKTDGTPPSVTLTAPSFGNTYSQLRPTFVGGTEVGARVRIWRGAACTGPAVPTAEVTVGAGGTFSIALDQTTEAAANGDTTYRIGVKDALDNADCLGPFVYKTDTRGPVLQWDVAPPSTIIGSQLTAKLHVTETPRDPAAVYLKVDETSTVRCNVDGGTSQIVPDGSLTTFTGILFGAHDIECIAHDALNNASTPLDVTITFVSERGGHVVLVGHDFGGITPAAVDRMLSNAVLLANPPTTASIKGKIVRGPLAQTAEVGRAINAITKGTTDAGRPAAFGDVDMGSPLGPQLDGIQVLLVPDQNDPAFGVAFQSANKSALDAFRRSGGVIIVLDGTIGKGLPSEGKPSETYQLLVAMGVMPQATASPISQVEAMVADMNVDPVAQGAAGLYVVPTSTVTFGTANAGGFGATLVANHNTANGQPIVLHWYEIPTGWVHHFDDWSAGWTELVDLVNPNWQSQMAFGMGNALAGPGLAPGGTSQTLAIGAWWLYTPPASAPLPPVLGRRTRAWFLATKGALDIGFSANAGGAYSLTIVSNGTTDMTILFALADYPGYGAAVALSPTSDPIQRIPIGTFIQAEVLVDGAGIATATLSTLNGRVLGTVTATQAIATTRTGWAIKQIGFAFIDFLHTFR